MLKFFRCPDSITRPISQCLESCQRSEGRCLALAHLTYIGHSEREWQGQSSVTQLIKPTRIAFLELTKDYAADPDDYAFRMYGSLHHRRLDIINKKLDGLSEYTLKQGVNGTLDRLEPDELQPGYYKLMDFKLVGAYSVAKALGIHNGEEVDPDMFEWELQLNKYASMVEADPILAPLFPISRLFIQATIRDSGLKQINMLKLPKRMPLIPVQRLPLDFITEYFLTKDYLLHKALETGILPPMCSYSENWAGRRCKKYCSVFEACPEGRMVNRLPPIE
jgi:hypothetical protein